MASPTPAELNDLSLACQRVWDLDSNRLAPGRDYAFNLQSKRRFNQGDVAPEPLFTFVNPEVFQRPNFRLFVALLDNYIKQTGTAEQVTAVEARETSDFLDAVIASQPMQYVHKVLVAKQLASSSTAEFKKQLHQMWFSTYTREVRDDSSGFEHVFVGEVDKGKVSGFHNWLQFYLQEAAGQTNYGGYLLPRGTRGGEEGVDENEQLLSVQFGWGAESKDVSSIWIGTSPEFEMALYSLCFLAGGEENIVEVGGYQVKVRCYRIRSKYGDKVGSSFPELLAKIPRRQSLPNGGAAQHAHHQHPGGFAPAAAPQANAWQHQQTQPQAFNMQQGDFPALGANGQQQQHQQYGAQQQPQYMPQQAQQAQQGQQPMYGGPPQQQQYGAPQGQYGHQGAPQDASNQGCGDIIKMILPYLKRAFQQFKSK